MLLSLSPLQALNTTVGRLLTRWLWRAIWMLRDSETSSNPGSILFSVQNSGKCSLIRTRPHFLLSGKCQMAMLDCVTRKQRLTRFTLLRVFTLHVHFRGSKFELRKLRNRKAPSYIRQFRCSKWWTVFIENCSEKRVNESICWDAWKMISTADSAAWVENVFKLIQVPSSFD